MGRRTGKRLKEDRALEGSNVCRLCREEPNEEVFGKFFVEKETAFAVHQYCMFFSSGLAQNGKENEGFDGFLIKDIKKEISRAKRLKCSFCRKYGATIGCCEEKCHQAFHYKCGRQRGSLFQFFDTFNSFCLYHRPAPHIKLLESNRQICPICLNEIEWNGRTSLAEVPLVTPCCKTWFHNKCIQRHAFSSGLYYFKCPFCNNKEDFQEEMKRMGVYIPDQDASWEKGDAFADLLYRYNRCDARKCICPYGTEHKGTSGKWRIRLCDLCGQFGTHLKCQHWRRPPEEWYCDVCGNTLPNCSTRKRRIGDHSMDPCFSDMYDSSSDEDCEVNVCGVSEDEMPLAALKKQQEEQLQSNSSSEANAGQEGSSVTREHQEEPLGLKSIEQHRREAASLLRKDQESSPLTIVSNEQVEDGASPLRKRRRLSGEDSPGNGPQKETKICRSSENSTSSLNELVLDSSPTLLFAISETVSERLLGGGDAVGEETPGTAVNSKTVENTADSAAATVHENEVILIRDTDSENSSDYGDHLIEFATEEGQGKGIEKASSKSTRSDHTKTSRSPHGARRCNGEILKQVTLDKIAQVEADSSATVISTKVEGENPKEEGSFDLQTEHKAYNSDDEACLITKVVKKPCPLGNDKFGKCSLRCCNPVGYCGPSVRAKSSKRANHKCEDLQITTVSSTSSCEHIQGLSFITKEQGEAKTAASNEFCTAGTNTAPLKLSPRKDFPSKQTTITETYFPTGTRPVSTASQTKMLNLRSKKRGSYLERSLKDFYAVRGNQMIVSHKCFR